MLLILLGSNGVRKLPSLLMMRARYSLVWLSCRAWEKERKKYGIVPVQCFSRKNSEQNPS